MITQEELKLVLHYDPETGVFIWLRGKKGLAARSIAGCFDGEGYRLIKINQRPYKAHRLAWLYVYGAWPPEEIDHINHQKSDNRIKNLRPCSTAQNLRSRLFNRIAASGAKGVYQDKGGGFRVRVCVNGKARGFGTYHDIELAEFVAIEARNKFYGEFANHGH